MTRNCALFIVWAIPSALLVVVVAGLTAMGLAIASGHGWKSLLILFPLGAYSVLARWLFHEATVATKQGETSQ